MVTPTDWVAIIGAAAWLPQIASFLHRLLVKPSVRIINDQTAQIGYTNFGPLFNIRCAFDVSRKDAVIEKMTSRIQYERGDSIELTWTWLDETLSRMRGATGEQGEWTRSHPAIALKVSTALLSEKLVLFADLEFEEKRRALADVLIDRKNHALKTEADPADATIRSKEYSDYLAYFRRQQFWRPGQYSVTIAAHLSGAKKPFVRSLAFHLSADEAERLTGNFQIIDRFVEYNVRETPMADRLPELWSWANPRLSEAADHKPAHG